MELLDNFRSRGGDDDDDCVAKSKPTPAPRTFLRKSSFKEIQSALSRIKPEVLKRVMAGSGSFTARQNTVAALPSPAAHAHKCSDDEKKAPLTIFYSGKVVVVDLTPDKAKSILRLAEKGSAGEPTTAAEQEKYYNKMFAKIDDGDLPIARRRSLQSFLQRRRG